MTRLSLALALAFAVAAGCGPSARYVYPKQGITSDQRQRDESECGRDAMVTAGGFGGGYSGGSFGRPAQVFDREVFNRCMESRGYEVQEVRE